MPAGSRPRLTHLAPVVVLLAASVILTVFAAPVCRYAEATAAQLLTPRGYIEAVLHQENKP
jgi:multicomponent K+:H+ antiporter subunit D